MTPNSFVDRTHRRIQTFYDGQEGEGRLKGVCHLPMTKPFCEPLSTLLAETAAELGLTCHPKGTVVCIEGPRFSTVAESKIFRSWGADLVNMTIVPEVILALELGKDSRRKFEQPTTTSTTSHALLLIFFANTSRLLLGSQK